jgi:hypothetical protein
MKNRFRWNANDITIVNSTKVAPRDWLAIGGELGVDFETIDPSQWVAGCEHETEHAQTVGGDAVTIAKIALDHLRSDPRYYEKLEQVE